MLNLDTHILLYALAGELTEREERLLSAERWSISAIVQWEIAKLHQLGRIQLDLDDRVFIQLLDSLHVWPLTLDICRSSCDLDFRSDPADEIIAATSIIHRVPLLTRDGKLLESKRTPLAR